MGEGYTEPISRYTEPISPTGVEGARQYILYICSDPCKAGPAKKSKDLWKEKENPGLLLVCY
jgi:hypothetical protein